jgi:phosphohistidine phosphatase
MRRAARGLRHLLPGIEMVVASPLTRAQETAEIVRDEYGLERIETAAELEPDRPLAVVVEGLARHSGELIAVVGHEPQLSRLVTFLVAGVDRTGVELKKGGACLIEFDGQPRAATGVLLWAARPSTLRDLAG